jgi:hypothetical protein
MVQNYLVTYQSNEIESIWGQLEPLIKKVLKKHEKDFTIESIKEMLLKKEAQLWTSYNGQIEAFVLTHIVIYPNHKICNILMCGGSNLNNWLEFMSNIGQWAKSIGCKSLRLRGRKGWIKKLPDFKFTKIIMEKDL